MWKCFIWGSIDWMLPEKLLAAYTHMYEYEHFGSAERFSRHPFDFTVAPVLAIARAASDAPDETESSIVNMVINMICGNHKAIYTVQFAFRCPASFLNWTNWTFFIVATYWNLYRLSVHGTMNDKSVRWVNENKKTVYKWLKRLWSAAIFCVVSVIRTTAISKSRMEKRKWLPIGTPHILCRFVYCWIHRSQYS